MTHPSLIFPGHTPAIFRLISTGARLGSWFLISDGTPVSRRDLLLVHGWTNSDLNATEAAVLLLDRQPLATEGRHA